MTRSVTDRPSSSSPYSTTSPPRHRRHKTSTVSSSVRPSSSSSSSTSLSSWWTLSLTLLTVLTRNICSGFYVPGVAPVEFADGDEVQVYAVKMTSVITQLPYDYYSLPFCGPAKKEYKSENLGEILRGDAIVSTPYVMRMRQNLSCVAVLCENEKRDQPTTFSKEQSQLFAQRIREEYQVHMMVDNLPAAAVLVAPDGSDVVQYEHGHRLGTVRLTNSASDNQNTAFLNNHLKFTVKYNTDEAKNKHRIVGLFVEAMSVSAEEYKFTDGKCKIPSAGVAHQGAAISESGTTKVWFSYEVVWEKSDIEWSSRWDHYLALSNTQIHWFSIMNSVVIIFFLSGVITMIMVRTLRRDIAKYNRDEDDEEDDVLEETGWKLVHGDVFRSPWNIGLLTALIGSGVQILGMTFVTVIFATLGMLSPAARGALLSGLLFVFVIMGTVAGFQSGRLYKTLNGQQWKKTALLTATFYPGIMAAVGIFLNFFVWGVHSSAAIPFLSLVQLLAMWIGVSLPLLFMGFYFGFRKRPYTQPVRTNQIPRQVPEQDWYKNTLTTTLLSGILPFGAVFIELYFIFNALWQHQFYYLFGFLFLVFVILVVSCAQIAIVLVYFQLCGEDYHWWWRSFVQGGSCAVYVFFYSIIYFYTKLEITDYIPTLLYFGYTFLFCFTFWIMTGTVGFYAAFFFIRKIYGSIKID